MAPYRAQTGGVFASGLYANSRPQIDAGGVVDALTRGATSLIQQAYLRRQVQEEKRIQTEERTRQHTREDEQDAMAREKFGMEKETHAADIAAKGYTPPRKETTRSVEPGTVESGGLFGGKGRVTAPRVTERTTTIAGAYDPMNTPAERKKTADRTRKAGEFAALYKKQFPKATPEEAQHAGEYAAENPSIADNLLFPKADAWTQFRRQWDYQGAHPHPTASDRGGANSGIGVALRTTSQQVDDTRSDVGQVRSTIQREFPDGPPDEYSPPEQKARYKQLAGRDSTLTARADSVGGIRDVYARKQQEEAGLVPAPAKKTSPPPSKTNPHAKEEARLAQLAQNAIRAGADPEKVNTRLAEQLNKLRQKK